ncbi:hypothetical protein DIS24_g2919 [Lasiodiplodia hormozganensis]|uniref:DUF202 domain-containing protein n=1 Tax=Lasiodiplodia hormozganensis TaxID=869390 RepID=A0AA39YYS3_9PEZI|nr:hypothetical protein DIS24_g2919 [Lasiodiplodia hormozganensis]
MDQDTGNGDEPTRAGGSPQRSTQHAQSNESAASTSSLPGYHNHPQRDPTPSAADRPSSPPANHQPPSGLAKNTNNDTKTHNQPHDAAFGPGTADDDLIAQPGGLRRRGVPGAEEEEEEERADDTALGTANDREATELASLPRSSSSQRMSRVETASTTEEPVLGHGHPPPPSEVPTCRDDCSLREQRKLMLTRQEVGWWDVVTRWWRRHVSVTVPAGGMRDHLALERTFLGYLRTSIALSMAGVMIAQLLRLQHAPNPDPHYGYHALGKPLAAVFITAAIAMVLLGAFRFWRQQNAIVRGKVFAGGWEILTIMIGSTILTTTVFGLLLAVDIKKEIEGRS